MLRTFCTLFIFFCTVGYTVLLAQPVNPYKYQPKDSVKATIAKPLPVQAENPYKYQPKDTIPMYRYDTLNRTVTFEVGPILGVMNPRSDITEYPQIRTFQQNIGAYASLQYKRIFGIRAEMNFGKLQEADTLNRSLTYIKRNLNYRTNIAEYSLSVEVYPLNILVKRFREGKRPTLQPYFTGGIGIFNFKPEVNLNGEWIYTRPLSLEGQGFPTHPDRRPYSLNAVSYPIGAGIKWDVDDWLAVRFEFVYRYTNTDYIDDISKRYIDPADFYRFLPTIQMADLAVILNKRQYLPGNTLSPGEVRGLNDHTDGFYTFNLKVGIKFGCLCNR
jgi:opacity protein-like surface antigen